MFFFFSSRRRHTRLQGDWSSDVCSSDLIPDAAADGDYEPPRRRARHYLDLEEGEGLARLGAPSPERHPRVQLKRDTREAYVPRQNLFRDREGEEPEEMRDRKFHAGRELRHGLNRERLLREEDFEPDARTGISPARAHVGPPTCNRVRADGEPGD